MKLRSLKVPTFSHNTKYGRPGGASLPLRLLCFLAANNLVRFDSHLTFARTAADEMLLVFDPK